MFEKAIIYLLFPMFLGTGLVESNSPIPQKSSSQALVEKSIHTVRSTFEELSITDLFNRTKKQAKALIGNKPTLNELRQEKTASCVDEKCTN